VRSELPNEGGLPTSAIARWDSRLRFQMPACQNAAKLVIVDGHPITKAGAQVKDDRKIILNVLYETILGVDHSVLASPGRCPLLKRNRWFIVRAPESDIGRNYESNSKDCPEGVEKGHWLHAEAKRK
jgi:hypothetical protein